MGIKGSSESRHLYRIVVRALSLLVLTVALFGVSVSSAMAEVLPDYGIEAFSASTSTSVAGMHPDFTTEITLKHHYEVPNVPIINARTENVDVSVPPGLIGNPTNYPRCTTGEFRAEACPIASQVGVVKVGLSEKSEVNEVLVEPLYNMEPPRPSMAARFAFFVLLNFPVYIDVSVRTAGDYGVEATVQGANGLEPLVKAVTTFWGDPADPVHDPQRITPFEALVCPVLGTACLAPGEARSSGVDAELPFMTNPTSCGGPPELEASATTYAEPGFVSRMGASLPVTTGCGALSFQPSLTVTPTSRQAGSPTGLSAVLKLPQTNDIHLPATAAMRDATVTLPEGMTISPGAADGLEACSAGQVGLGREVEAGCPLASQIGTATFVTPDLSAPLHGAIYERSPEPGHLFRIWLVTDEYGLHLKIPGEISTNPKTGQLTASFTETPPVPVEEIDLEFKGGARAPLKNPDTCGTYAASYELTPWSGGAPAVGKSSMTIDEGCNTGAFHPTLSAGTSNPVAGAFSPLSVSFSQESGEQNLTSLGVTMPEGLLAKLAGVELCPDAQASTGNCPAGSQIGTTTVATGPGPSPLWLPQPGKAPTAVYLAGPYKGDPYSLVVKTPAQAGPFDLGTVVVRAAIHVDPLTAQVSVNSDPLPQILEGVPVSYRTIHVDINRPGFALNPTNCSPMSITGTTASVQGATAAVSSPFQAANCTGLKFQPTVTAVTAKKASRANGASLSVKITYPKGAMGTQSWFKEAKLTLPKQLPARLTTLQKACLSATFEANPETCPAASKIGHAIVHTEVLPTPLEGSVYFVSYGNAKFPEVVMVLKGSGVTIDLHGETLIQNGITTATFKNTPDVPFESIEVTLPAGPFSEFGANLPHESFNFCGRKLAMPTLFKAQNGLEIHKNTPITITGCAKTPTKTQKLNAALKACHKKTGNKRNTCEKHARAKYASANKTTTTKRRNGK
jgi:hypothetical protein